MSLNWQCTDCEAYQHAKENFEDGSEEWDAFCSMRNSLIYATLLTGYPPSTDGDWAITEDNWERVFERVHVVEKVLLPYRVTLNEDGSAGSDRYFTPDEVKSMIGLSTNVGIKTDKEFYEHMSEILQRAALEKLLAWQEKGHLKRMKEQKGK